MQPEALTTATASRETQGDSRAHENAGRSQDSETNTASASDGDPDAGTVPATGSGQARALARAGPDATVVRASPFAVVVERGEAPRRRDVVVHICPACGAPVGTAAGVPLLADHLHDAHGPGDFPL